MAIYKIADGKKLEKIPETSFEDEGIRERDDLQQMLSAQPDVLEEGLFILADEYGDWEESKRRIDLLALDNEGRLVVVELKRSDLQDILEYRQHLAGLRARERKDLDKATFEFLRNSHQRYIEHLDRQIAELDEAYRERAAEE